jgi:fibronectin type III domain protein
MAALRGQRACLFVVVALATCALGTGSARADPGLFVGFAADAFRHEPAAAVRIARDLGATAFRITVQWEEGQTRLAPSQIGELDDVMAAAHDMRIVVAVVGAAAEAPASELARKQFCDFARSVVTIYRPIRDVVIWNEPNLSFFWKPQFDPDGTSAAPAAYEALLARCWDVLHAARPDVNVVAPATSPRGNDKYDAVSNISHSPGAFIRRMGEAYRASGRSSPLFDTVGHHVYGDHAAERPWRRHPGSTISEGDWVNLMEALREGFVGTPQPLPGECIGAWCVSIWYLEAGYQTTPDVEKAWLYSGSETDSHAVPDDVGWPDLYPPAPGSLAPSQSTQITDGVRLAFCQPFVEAFFNFQLWDQADLRGWQSAPLWADRSRKDSYPAFEQVFAEVRARSIECVPPAVPSGLAAAAGDTSVALEWEDGDEADLAGYRVYRQGSDETWSAVPTAETTVSAFSDTELVNGSRYKYRVSAYDRTGNESAAGPEVSATPLSQSQ